MVPMDYAAQLQSMAMPQVDLGAPSLGQRFGGLVNTLTGTMFPTAPGADPAVAQAAQRQALLMFGLGTMAAANRSGASFGSSLFEGYRGAAQNYAGAMDTAFRNTLAKQENERQQKREDREQKAQAQQERTHAGDVAGRLATGLQNNAANMPAYWQMVANSPDAQAAVSQLGLQVPTELDPQSWQAFQQQLAMSGQVSGPRMTPRDLELKAVVGADGKQMLVPETIAIGREPGYAPVTPSFQLSSIDLPGGMKQNVVFDPRTNAIRPVGDPFKESSQTKPTGENQTAAGFLARMSNAEGLLGQYAPSLKDYAAFDKMLSGNSVTSAAANRFISPEGQSYYQAASDWVRAKLRKESGASIPPAEMIQEIRTYFPVPGDSDQVIVQKERAREVAMQAMAQSAGPAAPTSAENSRGSAEDSADSPAAIEAEMRRRGLLQ